MRSKTLLALLIATTVSACGGGGQDTEPLPELSVPPVRENHALVVSVGTPTYEAGSAELDIYNTLNTTRLGAGAGALVQVDSLDIAARAHVTYMGKNFPYFGSTEALGRTGYTGVTPLARATKAGYVAGAVEEFVGVASGPGVSGEECLASITNNPYFMAALGRDWKDVGIAYDWLLQPDDVMPPNVALDLEPPIVACVILVGLSEGAYAQRADATELVAYPFAGQTEVRHVFDGGAKGLQPAPDLVNALGRPIVASMRNFAALTSDKAHVGKFTLKDAQGRLVATRLIVPEATSVEVNTTYYRDPQALLLPGEAMLVPLSPLVQDRKYTVEFSGKIGTQAVSKVWSFNTWARVVGKPQAR